MYIYFTNQSFIVFTFIDLKKKKLTKINFSWKYHKIMPVEIRVKLFCFTNKHKTTFIKKVTKK